MLITACEPQVRQRIKGSASGNNRQHNNIVAGVDEFILGYQFAIADDQVRIKRDLELFHGFDHRQIGTHGVFFPVIVYGGDWFGHDY